MTNRHLIIYFYVWSRLCFQFIISWADNSCSGSFICIFSAGTIWCSLNPRHLEPFPITDWNKYERVLTMYGNLNYRQSTRIPSLCDTLQRAATRLFVHDIYRQSVESRTDWHSKRCMLRPTWITGYKKEICRIINPRGVNCE